MGYRKKESVELETVNTFLEFLLHTSQGHFTIDQEKPDHIEHRRKAPDFSISDSTTEKKIAIEITSLYKSKEAGYDDTIWMETVGGLENELKGHVQGSAWIFVPELNKTTPNLGDKRKRHDIRNRFIEILPFIINDMTTSANPQRFMDARIPFTFDIRKRRSTGSWIAISRLVPTSQSLDEVLTYLSHILPGKDQKFSHPDFKSHEHVLLLDNQIPFTEDNLLLRALSALSTRISLKMTDRIFLVEFGNVFELPNPWVATGHPGK